MKRLGANVVRVQLQFARFMDAPGAPNRRNLTRLARLIDLAEELGMYLAFTLPGVYHCGGGPGADTFDPLAALEAWVEKGAAPETMVANNRSGGFERPVCAWPKLPYYRDGDPARASSFVCQ